MNRLKHLASMAMIALAATVASARPAVAQVTATGTIEIVVQDQGGLAVPGVNVVAQATDSVTKREGVTDGEGRVVLVGLAPSAIYTVTTELTGFTPTRHENVLVRSGQTASVRVALSVGGVTEQVQVTAESPIVDVGSATTGQDITLQLTESLPTGRSYQSYLQLVPGVLPDDPQQPGNPAAKSGVNYSDIAGALGVSSDNYYYFNGINVTDPITGTFGANLNTEIIQEQKVLTGGIPAEYRRYARTAVERDHQVRHERLQGLRQLLLPERQPGGREQELPVRKLFDVRRRGHDWRPDPAEQGLVLRQLPPHRARGRRHEPRHGGVPAHREERAGPGVREGHLGADGQRHHELHVPERSDDRHRAPRSEPHQRAR